jgi:plastocyanin
MYASAADTEVTIKSFAFAPRDITIPVGTKVTWKNGDEEVHSVISETKLFRSAGMDTGGAFSHQFDAVGSYTYRCGLHPYMKGTITVVAKP